MPVALLNRGRALVPASSIVLLGSASVSVAGATSVVITTTAAINIGDLVHVIGSLAQHASTTLAAWTIANSGTAETWTTEFSQVDNNIDPGGIVMFSCRAAAAHASGSTITIGNTSAQDDMIACALKVTPEQLSSSTKNVGSNTNGTSTTGAPGNATPTRNPTYGVLAIGNAVPLSVPGGGWTQRYNFTGTLGIINLYVGTIIKGDQVAINNGATFSSSVHWMAGQVFYPLAIQAHNVAGSQGQSTAILQATQ